MLLYYVTQLCGIGECKFKSEAYIDSFLKHNDIMYNKNVETTGGYIAGEVNIAIILRLLAGGDAFDLAVLFDIPPCYCGVIVYDILQWIINTNIGDINMISYLNDDDAMRNTSKDFSCRSDGILK